MRVQHDIGNGRGESVDMVASAPGAVPLAHTGEQAPPFGDPAVIRIAVHPRRATPTRR